MSAAGRGSAAVRRAGAAVGAGLVVLAAGCGVRTQDEPEILRTPPPTPTATPSSTQRPSPSTTGPSPSAPTPAVTPTG